MRPEFVYFDLGNVLCFFDHDRSARQMAEIAGSDAKTMRRLVFESGLEHRYECGLISCQEFVDEIGRGVGKSLPVKEMLEAASAMFEPNVAMLEVLQTIRDLHIPIGLLSNTNLAHWNWIVRQRYPVVDGWFHPIILSFEVQAMKPDRRIYDLARERVQVAADRIFFTDDRLDNVEGASAAGWSAARFTDAHSLNKIVHSWR